MIKTFKFGRVRLTGAELTLLRSDCYERDEGKCRECGKLTAYKARFDGDPDAYHMAHIKSRGAGGSDSIENVRTLCGACHAKEHAGKLHK